LAKQDILQAISHEENWMKLKPLLLIFLPAFLIFAAESDGIESELRLVVEQHLKWCSVKSVEMALELVHTQSPGYLQSQQALSRTFVNFTLKYSVLSFSYIGKDGEYAVARVKMKTEKVEGPAFRDNIVDAIMIFKKEDDAWKIWTQANCNVKFLEKDE
jgi:hypothetical protein